MKTALRVLAFLLFAPIIWVGLGLVVYVLAVLGISIMETSVLTGFLMGAIFFGLPASLVATPIALLILRKTQ